VDRKFLTSVAHGICILENLITNKITCVTPEGEPNEETITGQLFHIPYSCSKSTKNYWLTNILEVDFK
jgi:hypothetical protein